MRVDNHSHLQAGRLLVDASGADIENSWNKHICMHATNSTSESEFERPASKGLAMHVSSSEQSSPSFPTGPRPRCRISSPKSICQYGLTTSISSCVTHCSFEDVGSLCVRICPLCALLDCIFAVRIGLVGAWTLPSANALLSFAEGCGKRENPRLIDRHPARVLARCTKVDCRSHARSSWSKFMRSDGLSCWRADS